MTPDICFLVFLHVHHVHQNIATHRWSCMTMVIVIPWSLKFIFSPEKARSVVVSRAKQGEISMPHIQDYQDLKDPNHDLVHSVSLGSNPPLVNHTPAIFFVPPGTEKLNWVPPRKAKSTDNFNLLHMFNNKTYTDIRTAYKHLLPSYVI